MGDPLRGSPLRPNRLDPLLIWLCLCSYPLGTLFGLMLAGAWMPAQLTESQQTLWTSMLGNNLAQLFFALVCLVVAHYVFRGGLRNFFLGRQRLTTLIQYAVGGWLLSQLLCGVTFELTMRVVNLFHWSPPEHPVLQTLQDAQSTWTINLVSIIGAMVVAPLAEEILFRGIIQTGIGKVVPPRFGSMRHRWWPIVLTAIMFGALHSSVPHHIPALIVLGVILGFVYERSGALLAAIMLHGLFNAKTMLWYHLEVLIRN